MSAAIWVILYVLIAIVIGRLGYLWEGKVDVNGWICVAIIWPIFLILVIFCMIFKLTERFMSVIQSIIQSIRKLIVSTETQKKLTTIKDLQIFDDIWVKDENDIFKGWIWDISRRCITVVYGEDLRDFKFQIPRPMNVTEITQGNKTLYCNKQKDDN